MLGLTRVERASTTDAPQPFRPSVQLAETGVRSSWGKAYRLGQRVNFKYRSESLRLQYSLVRVPASQEDALDVVPMCRRVLRQGHPWVLDVRGEGARHTRENDDRSAEGRGHHTDLGVSVESAGVG